MKSLKQKTYAGHIYKVSHPMINGVYIGQTVKHPEQRLKDHIRDANGKKKPSKGLGALYEVIRAFGPEKFSVETLERVETLKELNTLETYYQEKFDSVQNGLNRVKAPQTTPSSLENIKINIDGKQYLVSSKAELCRELDISYTSLSYWTNKREFPLEEAVIKAIEGKRRESEKGFYCFRKFYKTYTELAQDKRVNKYKLNGKEIAARVRKGMSPEDAVSTPKKENPTISIEVDGKPFKFPKINDAYKALSKVHKLPAYSTVVQRIDQGETPEEAFGFLERPWKDRFSELFQLEKQKDYQWIGELKSWSIPIVLHDTKEIFASKRDFARVYGLEYTETSKKLKKGYSPEKILKESGHIPTEKKSL